MSREKIAVLATLNAKEKCDVADARSGFHHFRMTIMAISTLGFSASTFAINAGSATGAEAIAEGDERRTVSAYTAKTISGDISDNLSTSAKQLLKRLAELQSQLRDLRSRMQAAENAAYSNLAARTSVVSSFQSQISAITGTILLMSASLFKELDRSGGLDITA